MLLLQEKSSDFTDLWSELPGVTRTTEVESEQYKEWAAEDKFYADSINACYNEINRLEDEIDDLTAANKAIQASLEQIKTKYRDVQVTRDIVLDDATFTLSEVSSFIRTLNGNGFKIIYPVNDNISSSLMGYLEKEDDYRVRELGVVNGRIVSIVDQPYLDPSIFYNSFDTPGTSTMWRVVGPETCVNLTNNRQLPEAFYSVRNTWGFYMKDFDINSSAYTISELSERIKYVAKESVSEKYRIYKVTYYDEHTKTHSEENQTFFANFDTTTGEALASDMAIERSEYSLDKCKNANGFLYVYDDLKSVISSLKVPNLVAYDSGAKIWGCGNAVFVDDNDKPVYVWKDFRAYKLSYNRRFSPTGNEVTVCLPFELQARNIEQIDPATGRGKNGGIIKIMMFDHYDKDAEKFWFQYTNDNVPANTPAVLRFSLHTNEGPAPERLVYFADGGNRDVKATPFDDDELVRKTGANPEEYKKMRGTLKLRYAEDLASAGDYEVYGFSKGKFLRATGSSYFAPMRAYLRLPVEKGVQAPQLLSIGYLDEDGNVDNGGVSTGIAGTSAAAAGFKAVGAHRAVEITADADCDVKIYSLSGKLVKSLRAEAGKTSVPVETGAYVVNGLKVIVK